MNYLEEYKKWCESTEFDEETKKELNKLKEEVKSLNEKLTELTDKELEQVSGGQLQVGWSFGVAESYCSYAVKVLYKELFRY